jgi:hypothetical protein
MSNLDRIVTLVQRQGYEIRVYANNHAVFGFGIYQELRPAHKVQIGYCVFQNTNNEEVLQFAEAGIGVRVFNTHTQSPEAAQRHFEGALVRQLEIR